MKSNVDWTAIPFSEYPLVASLKLIRTHRRWKKETIYSNHDKTRYYHKDPLHGEVEFYDKRGNHLGVLTPDGELHPTKGRVKGRRISI
ncbi:colicin E3/pyocin S6 family cytotoxin [Paenibacillus sp. VCA1]|uniref:colicin E3/pyocin S6 family cytotoxin n=1 Tax=Paenibacillus sp. VCA1 TaxID=3039148 RepID=UPI00287126E5|nr:colicin E3/pyocin S6 family cytotoxin [Paenibacillus sp. VCA1]MDR9855662.1 colicin E3/pyocin S6 family cytotoxin [Paenibacillus sp. VCA1]